MIFYQILIIEKDALAVFEITFIILFSISIGSFLNVLIYRLPLRISLTNPKRSFCPQCQYNIPWYQNIPIISFLLLKGKCSSCKKSISFTYSLVEIVTVSITIILYQKIGLSYEFYLITLIFYTLLCLSIIDFKYKAVPDILLLLLLILTLHYIFTYNTENISTFLMFAGGIVIIEFFVTFYVQNIKSRILKNNKLKEQKALGEGDIPIVALIGGIMGLHLGLFTIFLSAILAIIPSMINTILKKEIETPFIPYLSLAFFITYTNKNIISTFIQGLI